MNSQSTNAFRWSIRITGDNYIYIGIASKLRQLEWIEDVDENAILYFPYTGEIYTENELFQDDIIKAKNGDEVHFRFQPKIKKFSISFVSSMILDCFYREFQKDEEHLINIKEDVDYFPVVQGYGPDVSATLFKPQEQ